VLKLFWLRRRAARGTKPPRAATRSARGVADEQWDGAQISSAPAKAITAFAARALRLAQSAWRRDRNVDRP
jgi:hypothetical protein